MTWTPEPQNPCTDTCCTTGPVKPADETGAGNTSRGVIRHPLGGITYPIDPTDPDGQRMPGGGDRLPARQRKTRPLKREPGGVSTQPTNTKGTT